MCVCVCVCVCDCDEGVYEMICRGWGNISTHKIVSLRYLRIYTYIMSLLVCLSLGFKIDKLVNSSY